jgi:hypothetical protein
VKDQYSIAYRWYGSFVVAHRSVVDIILEGGGGGSQPKLICERFGKKIDTFMTCTVPYSTRYSIVACCSMPKKKRQEVLLSLLVS